MGDLPIRRPVAHAPDARVQGQPRLVQRVVDGTCRPRPTRVRTAVALTALSFVPDLTFGFDTGSAATLIALQTVVAAIVVPTLAVRLARKR